MIAAGPNRRYDEAVRNAKIKKTSKDGSRVADPETPISWGVCVCTF